MFAKDNKIKNHPSNVILPNPTIANKNVNIIHNVRNDQHPGPERKQDKKLMLKVSLVNDDQNSENGHEAKQE